jgi:hypothetical protein
MERGFGILDGKFRCLVPCKMVPIYLAALLGEKVQLLWVCRSCICEPLFGAVMAYNRVGCA